MPVDKERDCSKIMAGLLSDGESHMLISAFIKQLQQGLKAISSNPGGLMNYSNIKDLTNFGKLLHKDGLWSLYSFDDTLSIMFHLCRGHGHIQRNSPVDPNTGRCSACTRDAPDGIQGLWKLHNWERIQGYGNV